MTAATRCSVDRLSISDMAEGSGRRVGSSCSEAAPSNRFAVRLGYPALSAPATADAHFRAASTSARSAAGVNGLCRTAAPRASSCSSLPAKPVMKTIGMLCPALRISSAKHRSWKGTVGWDSASSGHGLNARLANTIQRKFIPGEHVEACDPKNSASGSGRRKSNPSTANGTPTCDFWPRKPGFRPSCLARRPNAQTVGRWS